MSNIQSINPATGETLESFQPLTASQIEQKLAAAEKAFRAHRRDPFPSRAAHLLKAAEILESDAVHFARIMAIEMGKPLKDGIAEAKKCASVCRYYAENGERFLAEETMPSGSAKSRITFQPIGIVLAVMPWNFPFWQVFRFAAPALLAGNAGLLKHASNVPRCSLAIEEIFLRAGLPQGLFQSLLIGAAEVESLLADARIAAATLTGSEPAGAKVAAAAGRNIKKTVLELGGSDPFIVMPGADLARAAAVGAQARCMNTGQSCIAAKRFIIHTALYPEFERRFADAMRELKVGDPLDEQTDLGPLATESILSDLEKQVNDTVTAGARLLMGGHRLDRIGNYFAPTILADIPRNSPAWSEEFFGPVALLFEVAGIEEAINLANATRFGLGASVWTDKESDQARFIDEIEAGMVFVNGMVSSDPRLPFGGVKSSGYGRELGPLGIREFVNAKTVSIH